MLTRGALLERRPSTYEVAERRQLGQVSALIRFVDEPEWLGVEWADGSAASMYVTPAREALLAAVLDATQVWGGVCGGVCGSVCGGTISYTHQIYAPQHTRSNVHTGWSLSSPPPHNRGMLLWETLQHHVLPALCNSTLSWSACVCIIWRLHVCCVGG